MPEPTERQIEKIKEAMTEPEEPETEFQAEIEQLSKSIINLEHKLEVNKLMIVTLRENDHVKKS